MTDIEKEDGAKVSKNTFRTADHSLSRLLGQIHSGEVQLPDFQREWVWNDNRIRSLIADISMSYTVGAVMLLETADGGAIFKPRAVQDTPENKGKEPEMMILDGQQRLTSLYFALRSGRPVPTRTDKGEEVERVYYLDIAKCLDPEADREDAVVSLPPTRMRRANFDRVVELDVSTKEKEYEQGFFPLEKVFDVTESFAWGVGYQQLFEQNEIRLKDLAEFQRKVLPCFLNYRVPVIELSRNTGKEEVCRVFEKVNTGGATLTVFDLMAATFSADGFDLRSDWEARLEKFRGKEILASVNATDFLQAVTLLAGYRKRPEKTGVSCKRKDILNLTLEQYKEHADLIEKSFDSAAHLLVQEKVFDARDLPYREQLVPLSAICAELGKRFESETVKQKLARWYWSGVFGELYGGETDSRFANDIVDVIAWVEGGTELPKTVRDTNMSPTRLLTLRTRQSAAYKGMMALLIKEGSKDFISGESIETATFFNQAVDIHHIFPRAYCEKEEYTPQRWNSVINKAPITRSTNGIIGGNAPNRYLSNIEQNYGVTTARLDEILSTHLVNPDLLRANDFDGFFRDRACRLLDIVEKAIGKAVVGRDSDEVVEAFGGKLVSSNPD